MEKFAEKSELNKKRKFAEKANVSTSAGELKNIQCYKCGMFGHMRNQCPDQRVCKICGNGSHLTEYHRYNNYKSNNKTNKSNKRKENANNATQDNNNKSQSKGNNKKSNKFKKKDNKAEKRTNLKQKFKSRLKEERDENHNYSASENDDAESANLMFEHAESDVVEECYQSVLIDVNDPMLRSKMIIDSGATSHMIPDFKEFINFKSEISYIKLGNNSNIISKGRGDTRYLKNAMYFPSLKYGLISISKLTEPSFTYKKVVICKRNGEVKMIGEHCNGLYLLTKVDVKKIRK